VQAHVQSPNLIRDLSAAHWIFVAGSFEEVKQIEFSY
jgi:hypothetical protein